MGVKKSLVYGTLQYFCTYGLAYNPHTHKIGRNRTLFPVDIKFIMVLVGQKHCIYLNEIWQALSERRGCLSRNSRVYFGALTLAESVYLYYDGPDRRVMKHGPSRPLRRANTPTCDAQRSREVHMASTTPRHAVSGQNVVYHGPYPASLDHISTVWRSGVM